MCATRAMVIVQVVLLLAGLASTVTAQPLTAEEGDTFKLETAVVIAGSVAGTLAVA